MNYLEQLQVGIVVLVSITSSRRRDNKKEESEDVRLNVEFVTSAFS